MNVATVVMEILRASGVRYLFGNPGTTELTFLDALPDSGLEYIVALQEATAVADAETAARAAALLAGATRPRIVAGDGVARSRAMPALVTLAERWGARVHGEPIYRRTVFPSDHALWRGGLYPTVSAVRKAFDN